MIDYASIILIHGLYFSPYLPLMKFTAAVVQAAPVLFDLEATLDKTEKLVKEAAGQGASGKRISLAP